GDSSASGRLPGDPFAGEDSSASGRLPGDPFAGGDSSASGRRPGDPFESRTPDPGRRETPEALVTFGGYIESRNRLSVRGQDPAALTQKAHLELSAKKGPWSFYGSLEGWLEGAAHYWPGNHSFNHGEVRESYVSFDSEKADFYLGRRLVRWGTSDGWNPLDLINPLDLNDPFQNGRSLNRVPQWLAGLSLSLGPVKAEAVAVPEAGVMKMPAQGHPWEPRAYRSLRLSRDRGLIGLSPADRPSRFLKDGAAGLRLSTNIQGFDLEVLAWRGYFEEPLFRMELTPAGIRARGEYARYTVFGLAFAKGLGSQTIRGEAAVKPDQPRQGTSGWHRSHLTQAVLGWDGSFQGRYYLNFQYFAEFQSPAGPLPRDVRQGLTYEGSVQWAQDVWKAGVRGQQSITGDGSLSEGFVEYLAGDHLKLSAGVMFFSGPETSQTGQFDGNDFFHLTARWSF
ncbi:MAG: hypothetical protein LBK52_00185, partial [Deltaproteobacteria bacterium]|nr:hypothetical protein [Deltaproteobacteria bacterium]